jgi:hypothetical protein
VPSRAELERRVDELAAEHSGQEFADAVAAYAQGLGEEARAELESILLQRARALEDAVGDRFEAKGWLRRTFGGIAGDEAKRRPR